jgi:hypothetical protein
MFLHATQIAVQCASAQLWHWLAFGSDSAGFAFCSLAACRSPNSRSVNAAFTSASYCRSCGSYCFSATSPSSRFNSTSIRICCGLSICCRKIEQVASLGTLGGIV